MSKQDLQAMAYEFQRQNLAVQQPRQNDEMTIDNVKVISERSIGATPSAICSIAVTNSDDYADPDTSEGMWVEVRYEDDPRGGKKYTIHLSDNGLAGHSEKVDYISIDQVGAGQAREKAVRKVAEILR